jgi:hypothetical protein
MTASRMSNANHWQYINPHCPTLVDPRLGISKQMEWSNPNSTITPWTGIEPDNYNYAMFDLRPHELEFIQDQCWYRIDMIIRRKQVKGWFSVYHTLDNVAFNRAILKIQPQAVWRHPKPTPVRIRKTLMQKEMRANTGATNLTTEERLWQMGYFNVYKHKYLDDEAYLKVVGTPRGIALNPVHEELDYDEF